MDDRFILATRAARPEDVLAIFRDAVRLLGLPTHPLDGNAAPLELTGDTPVEEWRAIMRPVWENGSPVARIEAWFDAHASPGEWERVLQPKTPLREVCALIASCTRLPVVRPAPFLWGSSDAVGAFFAVRELMRRARLEVDDLTPSSPLAPFLSQHGELLPKLILLAPGRLPAAVRIAPEWFAGVTIAWGVLTALSVLWLALSLVAIGFGWSHGWGPGAWASLVGALAACVAAANVPRVSRSLIPYEIRLGELNTFRDLSYALVCRRRLRSRRGSRVAAPVKLAAPAPSGPVAVPVEPSRAP
ncbi:MAG TPA: hypothetical protein VGE52_13420 [Pirellulales bacterium]